MNFAAISLSERIINELTYAPNTMRAFYIYGRLSNVHQLVYQAACLSGKYLRTNYSLSPFVLDDEVLRKGSINLYTICKDISKTPNPACLVLELAERMRYYKTAVIVISRYPPQVALPRSCGLWNISAIYDAYHIMSYDGFKIVDHN